MHEILRYQNPLETPKEPPDENFPGDKKFSTFFRKIPLWLNKIFAPDKWAAPEISETPETSRGKKMVPFLFFRYCETKRSRFFFGYALDGLPKLCARHMSTFAFDSFSACFSFRP